MASIFSILGPLASLGGAATGNPILGAAAGTLFGALGGGEINQEKMRQRAKEQAANALIAGSSWASKNKLPLMEVTPWEGANEAAATGAFGGLSQALKFSEALKAQRQRDRELDIEEQKARNEDPEYAALNKELMKGPETAVASSKKVGGRGPASVSEDEPIPMAELQTLYGPVFNAFSRKYNPIAGVYF